MLIACVSFPDPTAPEVLWLLLNAAPFVLTGGLPSLTAGAWWASREGLAAAAAGASAGAAVPVQAGVVPAAGPAAAGAELAFVGMLVAAAAVTLASLLFGALSMRGRFRS